MLPTGAVQVSSFGIGDIWLGECAQIRGQLIRRTCVTTSEVRPARSEVALDASLLGGVESFDYYMATSDIKVDADAKAAFSGVTIETKNKATISTHQLIVEWSRTKPLNLGANSPAANEHPTVSSINVGYAIRVIFDITLLSVNSEAAGSFGPSEIATAIATNRAKVALRMDTVGVAKSLVPTSLPTSVSSVDEFAKVMQLFMHSIDEFRAEYNTFAKSCKDSACDTATLEIMSPMLGIVSYQVSNVPVGLSGMHPWAVAGFEEAIPRIRIGMSCKDALAIAYKGRIDGKYTQLYNQGVRAAYAGIGNDPNCGTKAPAVSAKARAETLTPETPKAGQ